MEATVRKPDPLPARPTSSARARVDESRTDAPTGESVPRIARQYDEDSIKAAKAMINFLHWPRMSIEAERE